MTKLKLAAVVAVATILMSSAARAADTFDNSTKAFSKAVEEYVKTVRKEAGNSRTADRSEMLKDVVYDYMIDGDLKKKPSTTANNGLNAFLCDPRGNYAELQIYYSYQSNISGALAKLTKDSPSDLIPLLYALSVDYDSVLESESPETSREETQKIIDKKVIAPCKYDIQNYHDLVYGPFQTEDRFFGELLGLIDAFKKVVLPALNGILIQVDQRKRNRAIRKFILDEEKREFLIYTVTQTDAFMRTTLDRDRSNAVLKTKSEFYGFFNSAKPASELKGCKAYLKRDRDLLDETELKQTADFESCHAAIMKSWGGGMAASLKAAAKYDVQADSSLLHSSAKVNEAIDYMHKVAKGDRNVKKEDTLAFVNSIIKIIAVGDMIEKATSDASKDKMDKAIEKFLGSF